VTVTKQQLENAARAMGHKIVPNTQTQGAWIRHEDESRWWNPLSPTTQGKADLQDLMLALNLSMRVSDNLVVVFKDEYEFFIALGVSNGNKHAALAVAAVSVASQIWESKNAS
jgi:hypothetical protein